MEPVEPDAQRAGPYHAQWSMLNGASRSMYEFFEHTADIGLRVRAATLEELFAHAGRGLLALLVDEPDSVRELQSVTIRLQSDSVEQLFYDWLNELLYIFETRRLLLGRFEVRLADDYTSLEAQAWGEPLDHERHRLGPEVKAATYHELMVQRRDDGWFAQAILDI